MVFTLVKLTAMLGIVLHVITCGWYAIGNFGVDGWTGYYAPNIEGSRDLVFWYFASCRWTLAQINGRTDTDERRTRLELGYTCIVAISFAVIFMALFTSAITTTMMQLSNEANNKFG